MKYIHETKQAYIAGCLTAKLYNIYYKRNDLPSVIKCMANFQYLKTIFNKYYNLLKSNKYCNKYVLMYEEFDNINIDQTLVGNFTDFMIGYSDYIKKVKLS